MKNIIIDTIQTILAAIAVFLILQTLVGGSKVEGASMESSLPHNSYVLVNKISYLQPMFWTTSNSKLTDSSYLFNPPKRGDIIVFSPPYPNNPDYVKRVIAIPGDKIHIKNGRILINDTIFQEPFVSNIGNYSMHSITIPPGKVFVLGDNRSFSEDSRSFGPIDRQNIVGKVWFTIWPINQ